MPRRLVGYGDATGRIIATFEYAVMRNKGDCVLAIINGANHFSIIEPNDTTTGRAFLDWSDTARDARSLIEALIWAFLAQTFQWPQAQQAWSEIVLPQDGFATFARK